MLHKNMSFLALEIHIAGSFLFTWQDSWFWNFSISCWLLTVWIRTWICVICKGLVKIGPYRLRRRYSWHLLLTCSHISLKTVLRNFLHLYFPMCCIPWFAWVGYCCGDGLISTVAGVALRVYPRGCCGTSLMTLTSQATTSPSKTLCFQGPFQRALDLNMTFSLWFLKWEITCFIPILSSLVWSSKNATRCKSRMFSFPKLSLSLITRSSSFEVFLLSINFCSSFCWIWQMFDLSSAILFISSVLEEPTSRVSFTRMKTAWTGSFSLCFASSQSLFVIL